VSESIRTFYRRVGSNRALEGRTREAVSVAHQPVSIEVADQPTIVTACVAPPSLG
jgi:hypothetical protein